MAKENNNQTSKSNKPSAKKKESKKISSDDIDRPLTAKERLFCNKYMELQNASQAVLAAGYKAKDIGSASSIATQMLNKVVIKNEIARMQQEMKKTSIATAQEVMEYFTRVMNGQEKDQFGLEAPLSERTKAAQELAKRTVDLENRIQGKADAVVEIKLDWKR